MAHTVYFLTPLEEHPPRRSSKSHAISHLQAKRTSNARRTYYSIFQATRFDSLLQNPRPFLYLYSTVSQANPNFLPRQPWPSRNTSILHNIKTGQNSHYPRIFAENGPKPDKGVILAGEERSLLEDWESAILFQGTKAFYLIAR